MASETEQTVLKPMFQKFGEDLWPDDRFADEMLRDLVRLYTASIFAGATVFGDVSDDALAAIDEVGRTLDGDFDLDGWRWWK